MVVVKGPGTSWLVIDRDGEIVSRHRSRDLAEESAGYYRVGRPRRREIDIYVSRPRYKRRRKRNPWAVESRE